MSKAAKAMTRQPRGGSTDKLLTEALERLVQLYDAWGKQAEAAKWKKVLEAATRSPKDAGKDKRR